jgi:hypothetical protein
VVVSGISSSIPSAFFSYASDYSCSFTNLA